MRPTDIARERPLEQEAQGDPLERGEGGTVGQEGIRSTDSEMGCTVGKQRPRGGMRPTRAGTVCTMGREGS